MPKFGKLLPRSSSPIFHGNNSGGQTTRCGPPHGEHAEETPMLGFNRVDVSKRMKDIVEQLQPVRREFTTILQSCSTDQDIAHSRPITTGQSIEPKLYGRHDIMHSIIHDITKGKYSNKDLTVLPIVGPGGIGKTTMIQHIYHNEEIQNYFHVVIWVCVSHKFNPNKLLEEIKTYIPQVEGENYGRAEELIEQRLKSKRFLLVLDDIWKFSDEDDWRRLLLPLKASQEKGSTILVTTRFPKIAKKVKLETTDHSIELEGLESKYFNDLFNALVFRNNQERRDHDFLLDIGDKIMEKLKGSPLAAKTVGRLLRDDLTFRHWRRVLESKEWESQDASNDIIPALKLSYHFLPVSQQQCFSYSALFPEDHKYSSTELINLWIGLDTIETSGSNKTLEEIGLTNLNNLVTHGFFKEEECDGCMHYIMHDLLHDLALKVAPHECLSVHQSNVRSVEILPSMCHLSIIIDRDDIFSIENFKIQLRNLMPRLKVKELRTLTLFGEMDESIAKCLGDLFGEANTLRVVHLVNMPSSVESMFRNFSALVHLRYLCLGTSGYGRDMHLPLAISRFYHLRILDLRTLYPDLPRDFCNLAKLRCFYTPNDELHSDVLNLGKLVLLEELKVFRVNKESKGFEPKQLEHLTELRELGIYNLENVHTKEEAAKAKLVEKNCLDSLTLEWDSKRSNIEPDVEQVVLESLRPNRYLEELCIRGHGGHSCPTWLGDELVVEELLSLHLDGVYWQCLPYLRKMRCLRKVILKRIAVVKEFVIEQSFCRLIRLELVDLQSFEKWVPSNTTHMFPLLQVLVIKDCPKLLELTFSNCIVHPKPDPGWNIDWFPKLQELEIESCPELLLLAHIPWTRTLHHVNINGVRLPRYCFYHSQSTYLNFVGNDGLHSLNLVLEFSNLRGLESLALKKCPPLEWKHLRMLTSLKKVVIINSDCLVAPLKDVGDANWKFPIEELSVELLRGASGKELTKLLTKLPNLSELNIISCEDITELAVGVDGTSATTLEAEKQEDGLFLFPAHLFDSLRTMAIKKCPKLVLVGPSTFLPTRGGGRGIQALRSLQVLLIEGSPKFLSAINSFPCFLFPSSLQNLFLYDVKSMRTLEPLSNLTSLTRLDVRRCGVDLRCTGLGPLLTTTGQLRDLIVHDSPRFFAGWVPNPRHDEGREELVFAAASKRQHLSTYDTVGLLVVPICSLLSSSLTTLYLDGTYNYEVGFTEEQEDALYLLASLHELKFLLFGKLQHLPAGLRKLTNLKRLDVYQCSDIRSLPKDGLPKSLQVLDLSRCGNNELRQQCRELVGTIPEIRL